MLGVKIRTKMKVDGKGSYGEGAGGSVLMSAVYSADPADENKVLTDFVPDFSFSLNINKQDAFDFYQEGKEYYVDFIPVEAQK